MGKEVRVRQNHSMSLCVVCRGRVHHKAGAIVVGRHPSGRARLLCGDRYCHRIWKRDRMAIEALWIENRA
jgi:hypothetical protein